MASVYGRREDISRGRITDTSNTPHAIGLELRMLEQWLGTKIVRKEIPRGRGGPARVDFEVLTLGVRGG